ncbi:class I SAM-dependent methyltransferase [Chloroflexota bacterium]
MFEKLCLLAEVTRPIHSMIEWGPGGGTNAVQFCSEVTHLYGVDISAANLAECERQLEMRGFLGFRPILVDAKQPELCQACMESPAAFFLSTAVYQHFPSKQYGVRVTELAHRLLADGGAALIQIRYDDGSERFKPRQRDYCSNVVTFTSYGIVEFWQIVTQLGFNPLAIVLDPKVNYAYYFLEKG